MKLSVDQKGFAAIEGILIFVIAAIIGGTGYYVYHSNQQSDKNLKNASSTAEFNKDKINSFEECKKAKGSKILQTEPEQCETNSGKTFTGKSYVTIKEWGVRSPYSGTSNLTYTFKPDASDPQTVYAYFSSSQLNEVGGACAQSGHGGAISRYTADEHQIYGSGDRSEKSIKDDVKDLPTDRYKQIGNYYYIYTSPNGVCTGSDSGLAVAKQTQNDVKSLLKNLQAIPKQ